MHRLQPHRLPRALVAAALAVSLAACQAADAPKTGSVRIALSVKSANVTRVTAALSGPALPQIVHELSPNGDGSWTVFLDGLPEGAIHADVAAFDPAGALLYRGSGDATVGAGLVAELRVFAQEVAPAPSYGNTPPRILGIGVSSLTVGPDGVVTLNASASDPDPGAILTYLWRASSGSFTTPDAPATQWLAPPFQGYQTIFLTVRDEKGAAAEATFDILVDARPPGTGALALTVVLNDAPVVTDIAVSPSRVAQGEVAMLSANATDGDGDPIAFQWVSDCAGTFGSPSGPVTTFVPAPGSPSGLCTLRVFALDGRGGSAAGWTGLWVGPPPPVGAQPPPPPPPGGTGFVNGGFESGDYAGWTLLDLASPTTATVWGIGRPGQVLLPNEPVFDFADRAPVTIPDSPLLPLPVSPAAGAASAFQVAHAPGTFRVFQAVTVQPGQTRASFLVSYHTLTPWVPGSQSIAVNLRDAADQILATPFMTSATEPLAAPWHAVQVDVSMFAGRTIVFDVEIVGMQSPVAVQLDEFTLL